ncbi:MAG: beta-galactosidase trimerization domain-containing protein, partial [Actinobacteria bacterium]|nr:beta-galactosidase trimerization domain-containing protein [Actinomycetota bacterium]
QVRQPAYPGAFRRLIGAYIDEYWPARPGEEIAVTFADGTAFAAGWWQESIHPESARVIARFASGDLAGRPAVLANDLGAGQVLYIGTRLAGPGLTSALLHAATAAGIRPLLPDDAPGFVEAARRSSGKVDYLFLLNHSGTQSASVPVGPGVTDLITGSVVGQSLTLPPLGVAVLACPEDSRPAAQPGATSRMWPQAG